MNIGARSLSSSSLRTTKRLLAFAQVIPSSRNFLPRNQNQNHSSMSEPSAAAAAATAAATATAVTVPDVSPDTFPDADVFSDATPDTTSLDADTASAVASLSIAAEEPKSVDRPARPDGADVASLGIAKTKKRRQKAPRYPNNPDAVIVPHDPYPRPYYFQDGLRKVSPYFYTYNTFCKERWRNRGLYDIFSDEFRDRSAEYYRSAIESGAVMINGKTEGPDYIVRNNDLISHTVHRHEPPVSGDELVVLHEDDDMIVLVKPAGIPVHPAGRYGYNSITEILKDQRGPGFMPYPCHRLDRLTSGIMFIAKNPTAADVLRVQIQARTVRKEYIARVVGEFPEGPVVCDQPILQISPKLGLNRVRANGKTARTVFQRLAYYPGPETSATGDGDGDGTTLDAEGKPWVGKRGYSIVRCLPVTGRTHQLRVHLQFLGHPIQNDPIYANQKVWGFNLGSGDLDGELHSDEDVMSRLERMGKEEAADAVAYHVELVDDYQKKKVEKLTGETCDVCDSPLYSDPGQQELSLWLHSLRYQDEGGKWGYVTPLPRWALPPDGAEGPRDVPSIDPLVETARAAGIDPLAAEVDTAAAQADAPGRD
ncbi:related to DRAP deaminase [Cephalotrichum gorgonifer]|uniref:Related to DRAP deaminase n=1 Tax=Cephalotrichum gorgonifer TaxID=2041049 RepID=A0AAE8MTU0_9PEZI|nr:related to DRAP deaminase [Cephalotrichum gorgonifer]